MPESSISTLHPSPVRSPPASASAPAMPAGPTVSRPSSGHRLQRIAHEVDERLVEAAPGPGAPPGAPCAYSLARPRSACRRSSLAQALAIAVESTGIAVGAGRRPAGPGQSSRSCSTMPLIRSSSCGTTRMNVCVERADPRTCACGMMRVKVRRDARRVRRSRARGRRPACQARQAGPEGAGAGLRARATWLTSRNTPTTPRCLLPRHRRGRCPSRLNQRAAGDVGARRYVQEWLYRVSYGTPSATSEEKLG